MGNYKVTVKVEFQTEDRKGNVRIKYRKDSYLVLNAVNPTDAEAKMTKYLEGSIEDFEVESVVLTKFIDVVN